MIGRWFLYLNSLASGMENATRIEMVIVSSASMWIDLDCVSQKTLLPYASSMLSV